MNILLVVLLLLVANGSPLLLGRALPARWQPALDGGMRLADGEPLFGGNKTWPGLAAAVLATGLASLALELDPRLGLAMGVAAMFGDLLSSFCKRRLRLAPGARAPFLDQLPECLLPTALAVCWLGLGWREFLLVPLLFLPASLLIRRLLHRLRAQTPAH
ncbi:MAG: CDP-archaeol synthase [Gammaproteobacteria bacterium]|nr:CDP-archaeol synthase [Gammaproteobacteria bacterium]